MSKGKIKGNPLSMSDSTGGEKKLSSGLPGLDSMLDGDFQRGRVVDHLGDMISDFFGTAAAYFLYLAIVSVSPVSRVEEENN